MQNMDATTADLEGYATRMLMQRGLTRASGELAFAHHGQLVQVSIDRSVYRGHVLSVHDGRRPPQQFRQKAGDFDWNAIAAAIVEIAERRLTPSVPGPTPTQIRDQNRQLADELVSITGAGETSRLSIRPSATTPGRVCVRLDEVDLDPASVIRLYDVVSRALPKDPSKPR